MPGQKQIHKGVTYTEETANKAISAVKCGMSLRGAAKKFGVLKSMLYDNVAGEQKFDCFFTAKYSLQVGYLDKCAIILFAEMHTAVNIS